MVRPGIEYAPADGSCWRVAWTSELAAFTVRLAEGDAVLAFEELDAVESTLGAPLSWSLRARLETDQFLSSEANLAGGSPRRGQRLVSMPGPAGQLVVRRSQARRRRHRR